MSVLVDSTVWISYFRGTKGEEDVARVLDYLLSGDEASVNEVIRTEVMPMMVVRGEDDSLLEAVRCSNLSIDWVAVRALQVKCLRKGLNKIGVGDLVIALDAVKRGEPLFSLDRHFTLIKQVLPELKLWPQDVKGSPKMEGV